MFTSYFMVIQGNLPEFTKRQSQAGRGLQTNNLITVEYDYGLSDVLQGRH